MPHSYHTWDKTWNPDEDDEQYDFGEDERTGDPTDGWEPLED